MHFQLRQHRTVSTALLPCRSRAVPLPSPKLHIFLKLLLENHQWQCVHRTTCSPVASLRSVCPFLFLGLAAQPTFSKFGVRYQLLCHVHFFFDDFALMLHDHTTRRRVVPFILSFGATLLAHAFFAYNIALFTASPIHVIQHFLRSHRACVL